MGSCPKYFFLRNSPKQKQINQMRPVILSRLVRWLNFFVVAILFLGALRAKKETRHQPVLHRPFGLDEYMLGSKHPLHRVHTLADSTKILWHIAKLLCMPQRLRNEMYCSLHHQSQRPTANGQKLSVLLLTSIDSSLSQYSDPDT